ncbi:MAG: hypothetical protein JXM68_00505, partial [Sedimentisphaerales bacterium]|nr:hypothetical protein [Sedimentisphaerales bacterium]
MNNSKISLSVFAVVAALGSGLYGQQESGSDQKVSGIEAGFGATNVYMHNLHNGLSTDSNRGDLTGSYDLELTFSLPELLRVEGEIFLHGEGGWGNPDQGPDESSIGSLL